MSPNRFVAPAVALALTFGGAACSGGESHTPQEQLDHIAQVTKDQCTDQAKKSMEKAFPLHDNNPNTPNDEAYDSRHARATKGGAFVTGHAAQCFNQDFAQPAQQAGNLVTTTTQG